MIQARLTTPDENLNATLPSGQTVPVTLDTPAAQDKQYSLNATQAVELTKAGNQYYLRGPVFERTPLQIDVQRGQTITSSTLPPSDRQ